MSYRIRCLPSNVIVSSHTLPSTPLRLAARKSFYSTQPLTQLGITGMTSEHNKYLDQSYISFLKKCMKDSCPVRKGLDIGAGIGRGARDVLIRGGIVSGSLTLVDAEERLLEVARGDPILAPHIGTTIAQSVEDLVASKDDASEKYDIATIMGVLMYLDDPMVKDLVRWCVERCASVFIAEDVVLAEGSEMSEGKYFEQDGALYRGCDHMKAVIRESISDSCLNVETQIVEAYEDYHPIFLAMIRK
eukprot:PhF_6_TR32185/c0_g2_i2/m.47791/K19579/NTM1B, METTL11B; protein N-terminal monomethyltransferase